MGSRTAAVLLALAVAALAPASIAASSAQVAASAPSDVPAVPYDAESSYRLLVPSVASGGRFAVIELDEGPGYRTPWHRHDAMEERYYVVDGTLTVQDASGTRDYPAGSYITIPPGAVHAQGNRTGQPVKLLLTITPGGFEQFFVDRAALYTTTRRGDPDFQEKMIALAGRHAQWLQPADPPPGAQALPVATPPIGSDRDAQGCIASAGYRWCERTGRCERPFELARAQGFENTGEAYERHCRVPPPG